MSLDPELFEAAADLIEERGWWQIGRFVSGDEKPGARIGGTCASNAIQHVVFQSDSQRPWAEAREHRRALWEHLGRPVGPGEYGNPLVDAIAAWNDDPERTCQEVLDALRGCAKECRP